MRLRKLTVKRLTKLADFMETFVLPPKAKFDMHRLYDEYECGTVGCALGWAAAEPPTYRHGARTTGAETAMGVDRMIRFFSLLLKRHRLAGLN